MDFSTYQRLARETAFYPAASGLMYCALGLAGEAGEVCNDVKKIIRDGADKKAKIDEELGDVLWYIALVAYENGTDLAAIAEGNIAKLQARHTRMFHG